MKVAGNLLAPVDEQSAEAIGKLKMAQGVTVTIKRARNAGHHRKLFALFNLAFDAWEPVAKEYKGQRIQKNFDQFRNDVVVLAGFYESGITLKGDVRLTAKSISFASMSQDEFDDLYNAVVNVVLEKILTKYTRDDLDRVVQEVLGFT